MIIHIYSYNIETGEAKAFVEECDDHDDDSSQNPALLVADSYETATYDDFYANCVYCESLVSADQAKLLVLQKCEELEISFANAKNKIWATNPNIHM